MKKSLLIICLFLAQLTVQGQAIPNADFENWSNFTYDEPFQWYSSNQLTVPAFSIPTVTPVVGFAGLSARIETYIIGFDTLTGYMGNTDGDILLGEGGVPYSDQPTAIDGYFRYEIPGDDTAILVVAFKSGGALISLDIFKIKGTELSYIPFSFPLSLGAMPDTVLIACAASNLITEQGITSGSWIEIDEISFTGPSVTQLIPGGTFDNWLNQSIDYPLGWVIGGPGVGQSGDIQNGYYALSLSSVDRGNGVDISAATSGQDFGMGGQPFTNMTDTLVGFYKYLTTNADTAQISISTSFMNSDVGGGFALLLPSPAYTPFAIPINSSVDPDSMRIEFYSSNFPFSTALDGSILLIDNLGLQSLITGINKNQNRNSQLFSSYPNPVSDKLQVSYNGQAQSLQSFLYNSIGELVYESSSSLNSFSIQVSELPAGYYFLKLVSGENVSVKKVVKQ